ncbi:MAG: hypothetical protein HY513_05485 [Candidatus Aenigmarchaeota archaeon]|nr:hypothetical protein [Candidatus Aenigmarchaeota archaeon]
MQNSKNEDALKEVENTIEEALKGDLLAYQRRIASMASLGVQHAIELYLHKLHIMKPGASLKHEWFKLNEKNIKLRLSAIITKKIEEIPQIFEILSIAREIEKDRNELIYGAPLKDDKMLRDKIDNFLEIKKLIMEGEENE